MKYYKVYMRISYHRADYDVDACAILRYFKQVGILIPSMKSLHSCIVTDRESAISKAIEL